jgi:hypothetical protein
MIAVGFQGYQCIQVSDQTIARRPTLTKFTTAWSLPVVNSLRDA